MRLRVVGGRRTVLVAPYAACVDIGKVWLAAFGSLMPEGQFEALWLLAGRVRVPDIYRDRFSAR